MKDKSKDRLEHEILELRQKVAALEDKDTKNKESKLELLRLNQILDTTSDFVSTAMLDRGLFYLNKAGRELVGLSDDVDICNLKIKDFHPDWAFDYILNTGIPETLKKGIWRGETALLNCSSGKEIPVSQVIMSHESPDGKFKYLSTIIRDITERKQVEEALVEYRDHLEELIKIRTEEQQELLSLFNLTIDMLCTADINGRLRSINKAFETILGYTKEELLSKPYIDFVHPDDVASTIAEGDKLSQGQTTIYFENRYRCKNGSYKWLAWTSSPNPETGITFAVARDITEKKQLLEALKKARDELEKRVEERTAELIKANRRLVEEMSEHKKAQEDRTKLEEQLRQAQKMEAIGTLAGGIAHDFNNILGIIVGNTELMMNDIPEWNPALYNLEEVRKASLRARDMVRQILNFSRQTELEAKPLRISLIIEESLKLMRSSIPTTIEIKHNFLTQADNILADPTQINQILMNLCTNASHAMREKGGILEVGLKNIDLDNKDITRYQDLTPGKYVVLTVSDTGHGIEPEVITRIFDPYFTTKEVGEGSGMGLAVVHGIVKNHRGAIHVYSEPEKGTTFKVFFPLIESETAPESTSFRSLPTGTERILFVDDETALADLGGKILQNLGYEVTVRTSSIEALEAFKAQPDKFDLLLTDMTMPNMTGNDLAQEILRLRPEFPIILCSGYSEMVTEDKAKQTGIKAFVMKPLVMREIAEAIRQVLDHKEE